MSATGQDFEEPLDTLDGGIWHISDHTMDETWIDNIWSPDNVRQGNGEVDLVLTDEPADGKSFTGAEIQTNGAYGYGRYEVVMKPSGEEGVISSFFTYTGEYFGDVWNEIDFEFLGKDPTKVRVGYYYNGSSFVEDIDLGFDASETFATYAFEWLPDSIRWYVNDELIFEVEDPLVPVPDTEGKIFASIWTGLPSELGDPNFGAETSATYRNISYTPHDVGPPDPQDPPYKVWLYNSETDEIIAELTDGAVIDVEALPLDRLSIVVSPSAHDTRWEAASVTMALDGPVDHTQVENWRPYALFGDRYSDLWGRMFEAGDYTLSLEAHSEANGEGEAFGALSMDFTLVGDPAPDDFTFTLVDTRTGEAVATLSDGAVIDEALFSSGRYSILATLNNPRDADATDSIEFVLSGDAAHTQVENAAPYALYGDRGSTIHGRDVAPGDYTISATAYKENDANGAVVGEGELSFTIAAFSGPPPGDDLALYLVDAQRDVVIGQLEDGAVIDSAALGTDQLTIRAESGDDSTESIVFSMDGALAHEQVENVAPYALFGDRAPDLHGRAFPTGSYSVSATAFSGEGGSGKVTDTLDLAFTIV